MGRFSGRFLLADFDGTFTGNDGQIPQANIDAAKYFISEGGLFTICTGRTAQGFRRYDPAYINAPVVVGNGAAAFDYGTGRPVFADCIGPEGIDLVRKLRDNYPEVPLEMYPFGKAFAIHANEITVRHLTSQSITYFEISDPAGAEPPWQKIMLSTGSDTGLSLEIQRFIAGNADGLYAIPTTGTWVEIVREGVSKASGMFRLADILGVERKNVACCGDGYNDVSMLEAAVSFAPSDGDPLALAAAGTVGCGRDEGIVAYAVEALSAESY